MDEQNKNTEGQTFDPSTLSEEARRYLDQERTRASKTARENAMKEAITNEEVRKAIKDELDAEAKKTADERIADREKAVAKKEAELEAKRILMENGVPQEQLQNMLDLVLADDVETTKAKATKMVTSFADMFTKKTDEKKGKDKENLNPPPKGKGTPQVKTFREMSPEERSKLRDEDPNRFYTEVARLQSI